MNEEKTKTKSGWRRVRRILIGVAALSTLVAIFYTEEDWRGKRAWENYKHKLEAEGEKLDWQAFIPPAVPDDENFFAAPKMAEWFVGRVSADPHFQQMLSSNAFTPFLGEQEHITNEIQAKNYLAWSDQFVPQFDLIHDALKRPYARMDGDYSRPYQIPIPNFIMMRILAQNLAQRAHCHLLLNQPEKALDDLTFLNDSRRLLLGAPTGEPMTLVAAMIHVAIAGVYANEIGEGLQRRAWNEEQLSKLQTQLQNVELKKYVVDAFKFEQRANIETFIGRPAEEVASLIGVAVGSTNKLSLRQKLGNPFYLLYKFAPRGWVYQNVTFIIKLLQLQNEAIEIEPISPSKVNAAYNEIEKQISTRVPLIFTDKLIASIALPNFSKAVQTTAHNQTLINEAQIACALERYRLAHGNYPESLDALTPNFIAQIPHDVINGQPLHYRLETNGQFVLYSVGWNGKDDGGQVVLKKGGSVDRDNGDWVWKYLAN